MRILWHGDFLPCEEALLHWARTATLGDTPFRLSPILALARANKVDFAVLESLQFNGGSARAVRSELASLRCLEDRIISCVKSLVEVFDDLPWVAMKTRRTFKYADSDIDVVCIHGDRFPEYHKRLVASGYRERPELSRRSHWREPFKTHLFPPGYDPTDRTVPYVHLHRTFSWNGMSFLHPTDVWDRRQPFMPGREEAGYIPGPEHTVAITIAHALIENKHFTVGDILDVRNCIDSDGFDMETAAESARKNGWLPAWEFGLRFALHCCARWDLKPGHADVRTEGTRTLRLPNALPVMLPFLVAQKYTLEKLRADWPGASWPRRAHGVLTLALYDPIVQLRFRKSLHRWRRIG